MMNHLIHPIDGVIPKPRALTSEARDLARELLMLDFARFSPCLRVSVVK
jgi:hypothetical protein